MSLASLLAEVRACTQSEAHLPLGPRPMVRAKATARLLIIGQAPGTKVHESGIPWNDPSGDRLRQWMGVDRDQFYDEAKIAIVPMGFCYPGRLPRGGDAPPRLECAPLWHERIMAELSDIKLTLLVGIYAQAYYLDGRRGKTMTETVARWREFLPRFLPTPHPSWRTGIWQKKNPWFDDELVPELRKRVRQALA
jgi:uracil-DNA glycosylase